MEINNVTDLNAAYGKKYPYAVALIEYFIFGYKGPDNILVAAMKGAYGRYSMYNDYPEASYFMLERECSWREDIEEIDEWFKNQPTNGGLIKDYF